jgi:hypothetical protein
MNGNDLPSTVSDFIMNWVYDETDDPWVTILSGVFSYGLASYLVLELDKRIQSWSQ